MEVSNNQLRSLVSAVWHKFDSTDSGAIPCPQLLDLIDTLEEALHLLKFSLLDQISRSLAQSFIQENFSLEITEEDFVILLDDLCDISSIHNTLQERAVKHHNKKHSSTDGLNQAENYLEGPKHYEKELGDSDYPGDASDSTNRNAHINRLPFDIAQKQLLTLNARDAHDFTGNYELDAPCIPILLKNFDSLELEGSKDESKRTFVWESRHKRTAPELSDVASEASDSQLEGEIEYRDQIIEFLEAKNWKLLQTITAQNQKLSQLEKQAEEAQNQVEYVEEKYEKHLSTKSSITSFKNLDYRKTNSKGAKFDGTGIKKFVKRYNDKNDNFENCIDIAQTPEYINSIEQNFSELYVTLHALKTQSVQEMFFINTLDSSNNNYNKRLIALKQQLRLLLDDFSMVRDRIENISMDDGGDVSDASFFGISDIKSNIQGKELKARLNKLKGNFSTENSNSNLSLRNATDWCYDTSSEEEVLLAAKLSNKRPRKVRRPTSDGNLIGATRRRSKNNIKNRLRKPLSQILLKEKSTPYPKNIHNFNFAKVSIQKQCEREVTTVKTPLDLSVAESKKECMPKNLISEEDMLLLLDASFSSDIFAEEEGTQGGFEGEGITEFSIGNSDVDILYQHKPDEDEDKNNVLIGEFSPIKNLTNDSNYFSSDSESTGMRYDKAVTKKVSLQDELSAYYRDGLEAQSRNNTIDNESPSTPGPSKENIFAESSPHLSTITRTHFVEPDAKFETIDFRAEIELASDGLMKSPGGPKKDVQSINLSALNIQNDNLKDGADARSFFSTTLSSNSSFKDAKSIILTNSSANQLDIKNNESNLIIEALKPFFMALHGYFLAAISFLTLIFTPGTTPESSKIKVD